LVALYLVISAINPKNAHLEDAKRGFLKLAVLFSGEEKTVLTRLRGAETFVLNLFFERGIELSGEEDGWLSG